MSDDRTRFEVKNSLDECEWLYGGEKFIISGSDLIALAQGLYLNGDVNWEYGISIELAPDAIRQLFAFEGVRMIGHWNHDGSHWKNRFICSVCKYKLIDEPTKYCPDCGTRMITNCAPEDWEDLDDDF